MAVPEPSWSTSEPKDLLLEQLTYYRATLLGKLDGLSDEALRKAVLPSGWSPLELLRHLVYVERRWMEWGFQGRRVADPWGDHDPETDRWVLSPGDNLSNLTTRLAETAAHTEAAVAATTWAKPAELGGRFEQDAPTLGRILVHLLQEYARHIGQLDVVRELTDGQTGE